ncbi:MAG: hypothetical protein PF961_17115 [Planctomycetota bacterium]|jgi:hypothetical protein|nr:hypothetical protein [Planctomycetota bacterium]
MLTKLKTLAIAASLAALPIAQANAATQEVEGILTDGFITHIDAMVQMRILDGKWDVDNADTTALGAAFLFQTRGIEWPVGLQIGYGFAENDDQNGEAELEARDLLIGVMVPFGMPDKLNFDVGGGFSQTYLDITRKNVGVGEQRKEEIRGAGVYVRGALRYPISYACDVSAAAMYSYAPADSALAGDTDINAGGIGIYGGIGLRF